MKETKYAYARVLPQNSFGGLSASLSHLAGFRQANIMFGHDSPVAHLKKHIF